MSATPPVPADPRALCAPAEELKKNGADMFPPPDDPAALPPSPSLPAAEPSQRCVWPALPPFRTRLASVYGALTSPAACWGQVYAG